MKNDFGKLTALVAYSTNDFHPNSTNRVQIEFGLGKEVAVNAIIGIPTLKQWKASIIFEVNFLTSPPLITQFTPIYIHDKLGYLTASPLTLNNSSDLEKLHHQVKP